MAWRPHLPPGPWWRRPRVGEQGSHVRDEQEAGDGTESTPPLSRHHLIAAEPARPAATLHRRPRGETTPLVAQPAIAMRARRHVAMIQWGLVLAIIGAVCIVGSSTTLLRLTDDGRLWPAAGNVAAVVNALVALMQWRLWRLALKEWEGVRDVGLASWLNVSHSGVWLSAIAAVIAPLAAERVLQDSSSSEPAWWLSLVGACCVILGATLAGVHRLHPRGPRGVPPHISRNRRRPDARALALTGQGSEQRAEQVQEDRDL